VLLGALDDGQDATSWQNFHRSYTFRVLLCLHSIEQVRTSIVARLEHFWKVLLITVVSALHEVRIRAVYAGAQYAGYQSFSSLKCYTTISYCRLVGSIYIYCEFALVAFSFSSHCQKSSALEALRPHRHWKTRSISCGQPSSMICMNSRAPLSTTNTFL
jgi:hypothetical protein